jgi:1,4-dihydroxy-2-naphthoate octaprenyltransferase
VEASAAPQERRFRVARGLLLEVRPLPMAAALLVAVLGSLWAGSPLAPLPPALAWVLAAVFFGLMTAHFMDSYVDVVKRGDRTPGQFPLLFRDSTGVLCDREYLVALAIAAVASGACIVPVALTGGWLPALLLGFALALALTYAPLLDRTTQGVSFGYPAGALAVLAASYLAARGSLDERFLWLAFSLFTALVGMKLRADVIDINQDQKVEKRTLAAVAGPVAATRVGYFLAVAGLWMAAYTPFRYAAPALFALPPTGGVFAFLATRRMDPLKGSLWMSLAMLATLSLEVLVLAALPA